MSKERLKDINMSMIQVIQTMAGGNPGAIITITKIIKEAGQIDPDDVFGGFGTVLSMDTFGIHDHKIWTLYKYVCNENIIKTIGMIRACQLGLISEKILHHAIDNRSEGLDVEETMIKVKEILPNFNKSKVQQNIEKPSSTLQNKMLILENGCERNIEVTIEKTS